MKNSNFSVPGILMGILYLALVFMVMGCVSTGGTAETAQQTTPLSALEEAKPKVNAEELIGQYSGAKDEGTEAIASKERFEAIIRQLADSIIVWGDAWAGTGQIDDGTAMQEVRFVLRLNESKPAVLDILDSKDGWGWQYEGMLEDKEPGAVNVLVRRILLNDGNPAVELVLVARDRNKKVTCKASPKNNNYTQFLNHVIIIT
jgi:hypothetical protein